MELEALLLQLVESLRKSDFTMFIHTSEQISPWMFAMDHTNYARWLPIFIEDLKRLSVRHPSVYQEFMQGNFTVTKTNRAFSSMGVDQGHKQNNKIIKVDGGAIGILDNETTLMKWMIGGPEIARLVNEFMGGNEADAEETKQSIPHHEDSDSFKKRFRKDVGSLRKAFEETGNPFEESNVLVHVMTRIVMNETAVQSVKDAKATWKAQYEAYRTERLATCRKSIYDVIPRNNLALFRNKERKNESCVTSARKETVCITLCFVSVKGSRSRRLFCSRKSCISTIHFGIRKAS
jgi:hypothetical protein